MLLLIVFGIFDDKCCCILPVAGFQTLMPSPSDPNQILPSGAFTIDKVGLQHFNLSSGVSNSW